MPRGRAVARDLCRAAVAALQDEALVDDGVGMGFSRHAGMFIVADGTDAAARSLEPTLSNNPATSVMRHADAGYEALGLSVGQAPKLSAPQGDSASNGALRKTKMIAKFAP